ncbi:hypothetical protein JZX86_27585 [Agrobacterium rosae]|uniref:hypothetical protein n=1 Tax=Agrobacterium rosae TaxID=1972867 RepID=UPI0019D367BB|nr:hypothetical protein [Agrobacterium rosae]MBN7809085.1 hypothetical protein [Agrobacterium rosae]
MGKIPWGRWFALLKVAVLVPIFILATATVLIIGLFDPQKLSTGAGLFYFEYEAKPEPLTVPIRSRPVFRPIKPPTITSGDTNVGEE